MLYSKKTRKVMKWFWTIVAALIILSMIMVFAEFWA